MALCGTIFAKKQKKYIMFLKMLVFFFIVALCGTMWHYVALFMYKAKILIHCVFDTFCFFCIVALCGTMWHYV